MIDKLVANVVPIVKSGFELTREWAGGRVLLILIRKMLCQLISV
jgi:hypothetical protein